MATLTQVCVVVATPTRSHYSTEQTAPADDSRAPGWLNINLEKFCTSSSQRLSNANVFPNIPRNTERKIILLLWSVALETSSELPQTLRKHVFCYKMVPRVHGDTVPFSFSWCRNPVKRCNLYGWWSEKQLKPEWCISVCLFVFRCLIKGTDERKENTSLTANLIRQNLLWNAHLMCGFNCELV